LYGQNGRNYWGKNSSAPEGISYGVEEFNKSYSQFARCAWKNGRRKSPFENLIGKIKPRLVIAHGKDAAEPLQKNELTTKVIPVSHFPRGWSQASAQALGQMIKFVLGTT
jgi:hypothetical protein